MGKIKNLSIKQKYEAIKMVHVHKRKVIDVAKIFNCGKSQIYNAIKNKDEIFNQFECNKNLEKRKVRKETFEEVNNRLFEWFCAMRAKNLPISGPILKEKAQAIARAMGITNFTASNGWLEGFKINKKISFQSMSGESHDVDENIVEEWKTKLSEITKGYDLKNIANADECGLFFRLLPDKSFHFKGDKCHGGKKSKERITVLLTVFANGTITKPLVIGKSKNPRCFKNINTDNLPVKYVSNQKAWMTAAIFTEYLEKLNRQLIGENRKILLFVDNATSHPKLDFSNINLQFLPANSTSLLQPLDNGVIQCVKVSYRKLMLQSIIASMDSTDKPSNLVKGISVLDAIMFINNAVKNVSSSCIQKSFKNCGFHIDSEIVQESDDENRSELQNLINTFAQNPDPPITESDYVAVDNNIFTENDVTEISRFFPTEVEENDEDENEDLTANSLPSNKEVLSSLTILKDFAKTKGNCELLTQLEEAGFKINEEILKKPAKSHTQTTIDKFFT